MTLSSNSTASLQSSQPVHHHVNGHHSAYRGSQQAPATTHHKAPAVTSDSSLRAPDIPLTGDAEADADILAFLKARQNAIQLGE